MKAKFTLLSFFVAAFLTGFAQQPPNGSFENFSNSFTPVGWTSIEDIVGTVIPFQQSIFTFKDSSTFTQGIASLKLVTDTIPTYSALLGIGTLPAVASLGSGGLDINNNPYFVGIPFTYRPDTLIFDYKLTTPGLDSGAVTLSLTKNAAAVLQGADYLVPDTGWVHMELSLTALYVNNSIPDTLLIQFVSSNPRSNPVIGTTLHVDGVRFGYINPTIPSLVTSSGPVIFCAGGNDTLKANTGTGYTYQWLNNGATISGATDSLYVTTATGTYSVQIDSAGSVAYSVPQIVRVNQPQASLANDTVCSSLSTVTLHGSPAGGTYVGVGVSGSTFTPATAGLGVDTIKYTATDANSCTGTATAVFVVENCTGINNIAANSFSVYPNPATNLLNINSDADLSGLNLQMFDVMSNAVVSEVLTGNNNAIDIAKLANGTYIYRITDKENNLVSQSKFSVVK